PAPCTPLVAPATRARRSSPHPTLILSCYVAHLHLPSFPTRRSSDLSLIHSCVSHETPHHCLFAFLILIHSISLPSCIFWNSNIYLSAFLYSSFSLCIISVAYVYSLLCYLFVIYLLSYVFII